MSLEVPTNMPPNCLLDRDRLKKIESAVTSIDEKVDRLLSHEGPISDLKQRISGNEQEVSRAHQRIDNLRLDLNEEIKVTNGFIAKVVAFTGGAAAVISAAVAKLIS